MLPQYLHLEIQEVSQTNMPNTELLTFPQTISSHTFSSCGERGLLFVAVHRLLIAVASLVAEHGLQARGLQ